MKKHDLTTHNSIFSLSSSGISENLHSGTDDELAALLNYLLPLGRAFLCFDGLDEVLNISRRREFVELVERFCDAYPLCPAIVTSRRVGYADAPMTAAFDELQLAPFNEGEITSYVEKFLRTSGGAKQAESKRRTRELVNQTSEHAADLRSNPLMLGLMSWLFLANENIPQNRPEIYSECARLMFEKSDPAEISVQKFRETLIC